MARTEEQKVADRAYKDELKQVELQKAKAELRESLATADYSEYKARSAKLEVESEARTWEKVLATDEYARTLRFVGEIDQESVSEAVLRLNIWSRTDPGCEITLVISSPGGDVIPGVALFDFLQELKDRGHKIVTVAYGACASMGAILFQAGDHRIIGKESYLLIHETSLGMAGSFGEVSDRLAWIEKLQERFLDIFATRSTLTRGAIKKKWTRKDWWLDSRDALEYGFADEVR